MSNQVASPEGRFSRWPMLMLSLNAALAALTATFVRTELIPANMQTIGWIAPFFVIIGVLLATPKQQSLRRHAGRLGVLAIFLACALALMHLRWVNTVEDLGRVGESKSYLVGFEYSPQGEKWIADLGPQSVEEYIVKIGPDRIPVIWGESFTVMATAYAVTYLFLVLNLVLLLAASDLRGSMG